MFRPVPTSVPNEWNQHTAIEFIVAARRVFPGAYEITDSGEPTAADVRPEGIA